MKSISRKGRRSAGSGCFLYPFGAIFFLVGSGVFVFLTGIPLWKWNQAQSWEATPCVIESSAVGSHSSSDGTTYSIDIAYAYTWEGQRYRSDRYNFMSGSSSGRAGKQDVVDQYPPQSERTCYVDPNNPGEAVLSREFSLAYLLGCFGLIFVAVGLGVIFAAGRSRGKSISRGGKRHESVLATGVPTGETITLSGGNNNVFGCAFLVVFGAIWNGVVFAILWSMISEGEIGGGEIFPLLFLIPFLLVGLGVIVALVYVFLTLFNPKPDLTLAPGYVPLGGTAVLGWSFRGNPGRIRHLKITLTGEEKATYRRGTSSVTDSSTFMEMVLFETDVPGEMPFGEVEFTVPEFTAPSFDASNNKIVWTMKVHGDIRRWPDVNHDFPFTVYPLPPAEGLVRQAAEFRESV